MLEKSIIVSSMTKEYAYKLFIDFKNDKSLVASILKTNKRSQHIFNKMGFVLLDEDNHFYKYYINI